MCLPSVLPDPGGHDRSQRVLPELRRAGAGRDAADRGPGARDPRPDRGADTDQLPGAGRSRRHGAARQVHSDQLTQCRHKVIVMIPTRKYISVKTTRIVYKSIYSVWL